VQIKVNGELLPVPENIRVREMAEAEKALQLNAEETGMAGKLALTLYIALRRQDPERSPGLIADEVLDANMSTMEDVEEEEGPLASSPGDPPPGLASLPTSGRPPLEASG
jgi:hypothetical protein